MTSLVSAALAQESETINIAPQGKGLKELPFLGFGELISGLLTFLMIAAALIFFFMLVIGGIRWIVSGGDKANTEAARNQITAALVGLVIVFAAWAIARLIGAFFGFDIFGLETPTLEFTER